jgi:hypothetical protein
MAQSEAPIHAKLQVHREEPSIDKLAAIVNEHHQDFPPAFVWAPDLIFVLQKMQGEIDDLKAQLKEASKR